MVGSFTLSALTLFPGVASQAADFSEAPRVAQVDMAAEEKLRSDGLAAYKLIEELPESDRSNYSALYADIRTGNVSIYWKGERPERLVQGIQARGLDDRLVIKSAPYSYDELQSAVRDVVGSSAPVELSVGGKHFLSSAQVIQGAPKEDGSGISLTIESASAPAGEKRSMATLEEGNVRLGKKEMPITVSFGERPKQLDLRDSVPARGGAGIKVPGTSETTNASECSTAFSVFNSAGQRRMMTAAHCARKGQQVSYWSGAGYGVVETSNKGKDVAIFDNRYQGDPMIPFIVGGAAIYNTRQEAYPVVRGAGTKREDPVINGTLTFVSGAQTGEQGSGRIASKGSCVTYQDWERVCDLYVISQVVNPAWALAGEGDSGGAVFWKQSRVGGGYEAIAQGILSGASGGTKEECPHNGWNDGRICSTIVFAEDLRKAMDVIGVSRVDTL
ncbi:hypothetical protein [Streptomyces sp. RTd22]|uniref:hypothetical protein n=1 Tax=Streptomyces sp. RTd22 TaxID=1841249 RepID=UPI00131C2B97|nr:hypothetical protein [Streptomyces sp. RTd22]